MRKKCLHQVDRLKSQLTPKGGPSPVQDLLHQQEAAEYKEEDSRKAPEKASVQISLLVFKPWTWRPVPAPGGEYQPLGKISCSTGSSSSTTPAALSPKDIRPDPNNHNHNDHNDKH